MPTTQLRTPIDPFTAVPARRRRAARTFDSGVRSIATESVRIQDSRFGADVLELRVSRAHNPLSRAYHALSAMGVRLVHTEVSVHTDLLVQRLHVLEPDDSRLSRSRLLAAARAVALACGASVGPAPAFLA